MTKKEFKEYLDNRLDLIQEVLGEKAMEYVRGEDVFHNFIRAAQFDNITKEKAAEGFMRKHLVSFYDMLDDAQKGKKFKKEYIEEKFGDIINYFILIEGMFIENCKEVLPSSETTLTGDFKVDVS